MRVAERLAGFEGTWVGENDLRMMPDDEFARSDSTCEVRLGANGNVATMAYTWADFDGVPQAGLLMLGDGAGEGQVAGVWSDSWHASPQWMTFEGTVSTDRVSVYATYGDADQTGGWHIHLHLDGEDELRMTMDNVYPVEGEPYEVVRAVWRRE